MECKDEAEKTFVDAPAEVRISCGYSPPVVLGSSMLKIEIFASSPQPLRVLRVQQHHKCVCVYWRSITHFI